MNELMSVFEPFRTETKAIWLNTAYQEQSKQETQEMQNEIIKWKKNKGKKGRKKEKQKRNAW